MRRADGRRPSERWAGGIARGQEAGAPQGATIKQLRKHLAIAAAIALLAGCATLTGMRDTSPLVVQEQGELCPRGPALEASVVPMADFMQLTKFPIVL